MSVEISHAIKSGLDSKDLVFSSLSTHSKSNDGSCLKDFQQDFLLKRN